MTVRADPTEASASDERRLDTQRRIVAAAMELFRDQGYDATTIDAVAARAGVSRRTFFHHFASKDAVLFLDHAALTVRVDRLLADSGAEPLAAVGDALGLVLGSYLADPPISVARYELIRTSPELRAREIGWVQRYQLIFSRFLDQRFAGRPQGHLMADVLAAGLVALHNNVLRQWLKDGGRGDARHDLAQALDWFTRSVDTASRGDQPRRLVVAVFDDDVDMSAISAAVKEAGRSATPSPRRQPAR